MTERWVSNKKYYCDYCRIFVADNKLQRQHHESGLKHKGNVERHLSDIRKRDAEKKRTADETARILDTVERRTLNLHPNLPATITTASFLTTKRDPSSWAIKKPDIPPEQPQRHLPLPQQQQHQQQLNRTTGLGEWAVVHNADPTLSVSADTPSLSTNTISNKAADLTATEAISKADLEHVYEENVDCEDVSSFKIAEKHAAAIYADDNAEKTVAFKKRKKKV
ncbi:hypothetical protein HK100_009622 [Physocladia obscura]|uniref:Matrin-type domain-containing protein n=1 Tax=Physocladia obscura TaxID=109957 RepID=A0AAD5XLG9_9FUNG|nr:hypothetical protein HK100_009622 [Physocladia obscura]